MKYWKTFLLTISLSSLVACGGGSGGDSSPTVNPAPANSNLSKTTLIYNKAPRINKSITINIEDNTSEITKDYTWLFTESPASNIQLTVSSDSKSVQFIPMESGQYKLTATPASGDALKTQFLIVKEFPFNSSNLIGYDDSVELSTQSGLVSNQVWVYSESLNQASIRTIVETNSNFTIIDFDQVRGLLVEFDETSAQSQININKIKTEFGIDIVNPRVFEGNDFIHLTEKTANDGSAFNDGGDNWHLEHIGIEKAWDVTTGNSDFFIGITDGGFDTQHEDLRGRFKEAGNIDYAIPHGTAIAGAIGAISNNNKGMSGINWSNQLVAFGGGFTSLSNITSRDDVPLVNSAWSLIPDRIPKEFDPNDSDILKDTIKTSLDFTRMFRKLATDKPNKLFIHSAGNGVDNGGGSNNGIYGVDGRYSNPAVHLLEKDDEVFLAKKSNVIFVAAHLNDNRLRNSSNYGMTVDIAAPAGYKTTRFDNDINESFEETDGYSTSAEYGINHPTRADGESRSFGGTSAASAVVTGVASLILAADQSLTASSVKSILINSATANVTERYISRGTDSNIDVLAHPIPILNAASALIMAKEIKDARDIKVVYNFSDPFTPTIGFNLLSPNGKLKLDSYTYRFSAQETGASVNYVEFASGSVTSFNPLFIQNIGINNTHYKFEADDALFIHEASKVSITTNLDYQFVIPMVTAISTDKNTQAKIPNVTLDIISKDGSFPIAPGATDVNGNVRLYLAPGKYTIKAKATGFNDLKKDVKVEGNDTVNDINLELTSTATNPNPNPGGEAGLLTPITPLTTSETGTFPGNADIPSFTTTTETGFDGDIEPGLYLRFGIGPLQIVDIQKDSSLSQTCEDGIEKLAILSSSDFSTSTITKRLYTDGQFVQTCNSTHASILPATTSSSNLEDVIGDWGLNPITTDCPIVPGVQPPNPAAPTNYSCGTVWLINHLITDSTGKVHKVSEKYTTVINN